MYKFEVELFLNCNSYKVITLLFKFTLLRLIIVKLKKLRNSCGGWSHDIQSAMQKYFSPKYRIVAMYPGTSN